MARRSKRPVFRQMIDQLRLYVRAGVLPPWYYIFELHDRPSSAHARNFIYRWESKAGVFRLFKEGDRLRNRSSATRPRSPIFANGRQVRTVPVLALASGGRIDQRADDVEFNRDLFVKPNVGRGGKGAERWDYVGPNYRGPAGEEIGRDDLFARLARRSLDEEIIVQPRIVNHAALEPLNNGALSTVRILTCLDESGQPEVVGAAMRMAIDGNHVVDNLHAGGIAAAVDLDSGTLGPASDLGADASFGWVERHPGTGAQIIGSQLPMWEDVNGFAVRAHGAFGDRMVVGWDIAITPDGPVLVEGNGAPDLDIMQRFIRHGLMAARSGRAACHHVSQLRTRPASHRPERSGGGVDPELAELAVERRAADPEAPRDLGHASAVMADRKADDVGFDLFERTEMPSPVYSVTPGAPAIASSLSRLLMLGAKSVRRPEKRDWIAICGKCSAVSELPSHCRPARNRTLASWRTLPGQP